MVKNLQKEWYNLAKDYEMKNAAFKNHCWRCVDELMHSR